MSFSCASRTAAINDSFGGMSRKSGYPAVIAAPHTGCSITQVVQNNAFFINYSAYAIFHPHSSLGR